MTQIATLYSGTDDPASDHDPQPGDLWTDTSGGWPFQHRVRTADGWEHVGLTFKDAGGAVLTRAIVDNSGNVSVLTYHEADPTKLRVLIQADIGGNVNIATNDADGNQTAAIGIGYGTVAVTGAFTVNGTPVP